LQGFGKKLPEKPNSRAINKVAEFWERHGVERQCEERKKIKTEAKFGLGTATRKGKAGQAALCEGKNKRERSERGTAPTSDREKNRGS